VTPPVKLPTIGLVTLNAKYIHFALSLRCLREAARDAGFTKIWMREYTLRTPLKAMAEELAALEPDVLGFSVYIWNRELTFELIGEVKRRCPDVSIVIGGPEVSFELGPPIPEVDVVIAGEGERKWVEYLQGWTTGWGGAASSTAGPDAATRKRWLTYDADPPDLIRLPYREEDLPDLEHRLAYLETSRGCPFTCSFCLSALDKQVRFYPEPEVKETVRRLVGAGARRIKFLDRTFNLRRSRVLDFFRFLSSFEGVEFHFEVVGDLLDEKMLAFLDTVPRGRFQFEVGVQSADPAVNARVDRRQSQERLFAAMVRLRQADRVHLHADLIFGLPGESLSQIQTSFRTVLALRPHELQLGFLKLLPGAPIGKLVGPHEYRFEPRPPYELIAHRDLTAEEVQWLKAFASAFDRTYNAGHFRFALERLLEVVDGWELFATLARRLTGYNGPPTLEELAGALLEVGSELASRTTIFPNRSQQRPLLRAELQDLIKLDYFFHHRERRVPAVLRGDAVGTPEWVRIQRKADPTTVLVPFNHVLDWPGNGPGQGSPCLTPTPDTRWYAIAYTDARQGYFFRPEVRPVQPGESKTSAAATPPVQGSPMPNVAEALAVSHPESPNG
jgi:anaerobic magnesium-protoporphyrin IX monomethyl ester cyclase